MSSNPNTNKRQRRPWDMGCSFQDQLDRAEAVLAVPSVIVDGTVYKSDRFYLHALLGEEENLQQQPQQQQPQQQQQQHQCHCGSQQPPPLFHREKFVHSLDLKAAILGTYTIDLEYMMDQFPSLVGPNSTVPTLILHGHRGLMNQINQQNEWKTTTTTSVIQQEHDQKKQKDNHHHNHHHHNPATRKQPSLDFRLPLFSPTTKNNEDIDAGTCTSGDDDDEESFQTQEDHNNNNNNTTNWTDFHSPPQQQQQQQRARPSMPVDRPNTTTSSLDLDELLSRKNTNQEPTTTNTTTATTTTTTTTCFLGEQCHLTQVVSAWTPPKNSKVTHEQDDETPAPNNNHLPEYKKGVHHPKFMLLFESSGDLIVVVSTANLSPTQNTTEGSWIQRFRKRKHQQQRPHHHHHHHHHHHIPSSSLNTCDFGPVLLDFIQKLSQSSTLGPKPEIFLSKYLTFDLKDIIHRFHFDKAQVHLVPGVPGEHRDNVKKKKQRFLYGRQRVQSILNNIPYLVQSKKDSLILQPTSFGANWKRGDLADVVRSYLNYNDKEHKDFWNDQALLEKVQILWPSQSFVGENNHNSRRRPTTTKPETTTTTPAAVAVAAVETRDSCLFLSSRIFNSCDVPCISRMALYQTSDPPQRPLSLVPHFKSAARLLKKREVIETKLSSSNSTAKEYFSWFLLTSACFSHGAQGQRMTSSSSSSSSADGNKRSKTVVSYANFELGVLFTSQWKQIGRGGRKNDRVYCFEPKECSCCHHQQQQQQQSYSYMSSKLIHLPVPYSLYPYGYFESEDDEMMQETPSFHEITDDSRCVGNMLLTPYGISQQSKKAKRVY